MKITTASSLSGGVYEGAWEASVRAGERGVSPSHPGVPSDALDLSSNWEETATWAVPGILAHKGE